MTELVLVRHGQAGPTPENYDVLSALGRDQSLRLGRWLLAHDREFSGLLVGRLHRQQQTLDAIAEVYADAGRPLPPAEILPGLDEYHFVDLLRAFAQVHPDHPELARTRAQPHDRRLWIGLLRITLIAWSEGRLQDLPESFEQFQQRIHRSLKQIELKMHTGSVLAVSSGGVMSQVAQQVLGFNDSTFVDINLQLFNTAVCEYHLTRGGLKLANLNATPHLSAPSDRERLTLV